MDTTSKKMEETRVTKIEAELVLDCLDFSILIINKNFEIIFANKFFLSGAGMTLKKIIGQYCYKVSHHIDIPCAPPNDPCPIYEVIKTGKPAVETHTHLTKENKKVLVSVTAAVINEKDKEIGYLHIAIPAQKDKDDSANTKEALQKTLDVLKVVNLYQEQIAELKAKKILLEKTKIELESRINDLQQFNNISANRELKMIELKEKIKEMEKRLNG